MSQINANENNNVLKTFLNQIYHLSTEVQNQYRLDSKLGENEYRVLRYLSLVPQASMTILANYLDVSMARISVIVETLIRRELAERNVHGLDKRKFYIKLSINGIRLVSQSKNEFNSIVKIINQSLTSEEVEILAHLLNKIKFQ